MADKTVLYVDDEEDIRLVVQACLEDAGYKVFTAPDVAHGLQIATSQFPDLIITDVMMPDESGYSFCKKLKEEPSTKDIPVVFLTVMDDETTALQAGGSAFLSKPFDEEQLVKTVQDLLKPSDSRAQLEAALKDLRAKDVGSAMAKLQQVVKADTGPVAAWARYYIGHVYQHQGDTEKAAAEFRTVLAEDPAFWRAHNRLGLIFENGGDAPRALKHFERSLSLNPNQVDVQQRVNALSQKF